MTKSFHNIVTIYNNIDMNISKHCKNKKKTTVLARSSISQNVSESYILFTLQIEKRTLACDPHCFPRKSIKILVAYRTAI